MMSINPDSVGGGARTLSTIGMRWKNLNEVQKNRYEAMAIEDRKRYALELVRWRQEQEEKLNPDTEEDDDDEEEEDVQSSSEVLVEEQDEKPKAHSPTPCHTRNVIVEGHDSGTDEVSRNKDMKRDILYAYKPSRTETKFPLACVVTDEFQPLRIFSRRQPSAIHLPRTPVGYFGSHAAQEYPHINMYTHPIPLEQGQVGQELFVNMLQAIEGFGEMPRGISLSNQPHEILPLGNAIQGEEAVPGSIAWLAAELGPDAVADVIRLFL